MLISARPPLKHFILSESTKHHHTGAICYLNITNLLSVYYIIINIRLFIFSSTKFNTLFAFIAILSYIFCDEVVLLKIVFIQHITLSKKTMPAGEWS